MMANRKRRGESGDSRRARPQHAAKLLFHCETCRAGRSPLLRRRNSRRRPQKPQCSLLRAPQTRVRRDAHDCNDPFVAVAESIEIFGFSFHRRSSAQRVQVERAA
jgi:hypothetical protein